MPRIGKVPFPPVEGNCTSDLTKLVNKVLKNDSIKRDCTFSRKLRKRCEVGTPKQPKNYSSVAKKHPKKAYEIGKVCQPRSGVRIGQVEPQK
jgi:hypothetical protein